MQFECKEIANFAKILALNKGNYGIKYAISIV